MNTCRPLDFHERPKLSKPFPLDLHTLNIDKILLWEQIVDYDVIADIRSLTKVLMM